MKKICLITTIAVTMLISCINIHAVEKNNKNKMWYYDNHTYELVEPNNGISWENANSEAIKKGGHLATITTNNEQDSINEMLTKTCDDSSKYNYWIGLKEKRLSESKDKTQDERNWQWITGEKYSNKNWHDGEPNNYEGTNEQYVSIYGQKATDAKNFKKELGKWNDSCNDGAEVTGSNSKYYKTECYGYIIEWDKIISKHESSFINDVINVLLNGNEKEFVKDINIDTFDVNVEVDDISNNKSNLLNLDTAFATELLKNFKVLYDDKNNTVKIIYGMDDLNTEIDMDSKNTDKFWKETYKEIKSLYKKIKLNENASTKKLYNDFRKLRKKIKSVNGRLFFSSECSVLGFAEIGVDNSGKPKLIDGGVVGTGELESFFTVPISSFPILYLGIGLNSENTVSYTLMQEENQNGLTSETNLNIGTGIGKKGHLSLEGGGELKLNGEFDVAKYFLNKENNAEIDMTGSFYLVAEAFDKSMDLINIPLINYQIYPKNNSNDKNLLFDFMQQEKDELFEWTPRNYNTNLINTRNNSIEKSCDDIYPNSNYKIESIGNGKYILVWVHDDGEKDIYNRSDIYYSIFDGNSWTSPDKISSGSVHMNLYPEICSDGEKVYVLWKQANKVFDSDSTMYDIAGNTDLVLSVLNENGFVTSSPIKITETSNSSNNKEMIIYEDNHNIHVQNGEIYMTWFEKTSNIANSEISIFTEPENTKFCLRKAKIEDDNISLKEKEILIDNENLRECVYMPSDNFSTDGNLIYLDYDINKYNLNGKEYVLNNDDTIENIILYNDCIYASINNVIHKMEMNSEQPIFNSMNIYSNNGFLVINDQEIITNNIDNNFKNTIILHNILNKSSIEILSTDSTSNMKQIEQNGNSDDYKYIRNMDVASCVVNGVTERVVVFSETSIIIDNNGCNTFDKTSLTIKKLENKLDAELIDSVYFEVTDNEIIINYEIFNNGESNLNEKNTKILVLDKSDNVIKECTLSDSISSGEFSEGKIIIDKKEMPSISAIKVHVDEESNTSNNKVEVNTYKPDLVLENVEMNYNDNDTVNLTINIKNDGINDISRFKLRISGINEKDGDDLVSVEENVFEQEIKSFEQISISKEISLDKINLNNILIEGYVDGEEELSYYNNYFNIFLEDEIDLKIYGDEEVVTKIVFDDNETSKNISIIDKNSKNDFTTKVIWMSEDKTIASIDPVGNITAYKNGVTAITAVYKDKIFKVDIEVKNQLDLDYGRDEMILKTGTNYKIDFKNISKELNKDLIYDVLDENIITVNENGEIVAEQEGETIITIKSKKYPKIKEEVKVYVKNNLDGWIKANEKWFFYDNDVAQTGWVKDAGKWYFMDESGVMQTGWVKDNNKWYYMNTHMLTGWQKIDGLWYYLDTHMITGWLNDGGKWYYLNSSMQTGWQKIDGKWYFLDSYMKTGWIQDGGKWYYMNSHMLTGWQKVNGTWYYLNSAMVTGWLKINNTWYYFNSKGAMVTGTQKIDGKTYKFNSNGAWLG